MQPNAIATHCQSCSPENNPSAYIGRFAPSPTGPLHLGSLFTALASFLDARAHNGKWLLRIDDLDTPRNQTGATDAILKCLETFGLHWDGEVYYQSQRINDYEHYLTGLTEKGLTYRCGCSRKALAEQSGNIRPGIYPGTCRNLTISPATLHATRLKTGESPVTFTDGLQGKIIRQLNMDDGDFILKRRDGIIAYQFAVVIDDYLQQISHVVRGYDLLLESPKQIYLQQLLGFVSPNYLHVPIIVDQHGHKLSKQTLATAVDDTNPALTLWNLLFSLKQNPLKELYRANVNEMLAWAIKQWSPESLVGLQQIPCA